ncbi:MAG: hypothetical protein RLZZ377_628, partial [Chloroflexota bacterium]
MDWTIVTRGLRCQLSISERVWS